MLTVVVMKESFALSRRVSPWTREHQQRGLLTVKPRILFSLGPVAQPLTLGTTCGRFHTVYAAFSPSLLLCLKNSCVRSIVMRASQSHIHMHMHGKRYVDCGFAITRRDNGSQTVTVTHTRTHMHSEAVVRLWLWRTHTCTQDARAVCI